MAKKYQGEHMSKFSKFMRKQGYYILLVTCVLLIATVITLSVVMTNKPSVDGPTVEVPKDPDVPSGGDDTKLVFSAPMSSGVVENYWLSIQTTTGWKKHCGIDYKAAAGSRVYSSYTGAVKSVSTNVPEGQVLVIRYDNGLEATYKGLDQAAKLDNSIILKVGSTIKQGQHIGTVSQVVLQCADINEPHLHFELRDTSKNVVNNYVNPLEKIVNTNK